MAIVKFINSKATLKTTLDYITKKTEDSLISGINCNKESAFEEMMLTKKQFNKTTGREKVHIIQSFSPLDNITAKEVHEIGLKFAEYFKNSEIVIATHTDKKHIHNHLVINTVNFETGKKIHINKKDLEKIKEYSNKLCEEFNCTNVLNNKNYLDIKNNEYQIMLKGNSWKGRLINAIDFSMANTKTKEEFILYMNQFGYEVNWKSTRKNITYATPEGFKCRDNKLHEEKYLKEKMEEYYGIKRNESITNSSTNEYENGRTSKETNIFRGTNSKTREYKKINGCNNEQYKQLYKGIKLENVQNRNNGIRYKKSNSGNSKFTSKVENTSKIKICGVRNDNKCNNINFINTSNKIIYTSNSLTNLIIELFKSNNNGMYREDNKNHSSFDSNAKLQYALNKHYSLEELDDELEI